MFPSWRLQLHEVRRALEQGRLDQAGALLEQGDLREYRQARELSVQLAERAAIRARGHMAFGHSSAGWRDLQLARKVASRHPAADEVERGCVAAALDKAQRLIADGRTAAARQELRKLADRRLGGESRRELAEIATQLLLAEQRLAEGKSAEAAQALAAADKRRPALRDRIEKLRRQCDEHARESQKLHTAVDKADWSRVLATAGRLLAIAPRDRIAQTAQRRAWQAVGLQATAMYSPQQKHAVPLKLNPNDTAVGSPTAADDTMPGSSPARRFLIWVDAVGGYLVTTDDEVVLGQPSPGTAIAVPIQADLSRRHAVIRRQGGAYTLDPLGEVRVDGRRLTGPMVLGDRHVIELGSGVKLQFTKPHALSATARLTLLSHHRTEPRADAVLLMADSCVLGPGSHCHIPCRGWPGDVILFRRGEELSCRATRPIMVGGVEVEGPAPLALGDRIEGEDFALSLEEA